MLVQCPPDVNRRPRGHGAVCPRPREVPVRCGERPGLGPAAPSVPDTVKRRAGLLTHHGGQNCIPNDSRCERSLEGPRESAAKGERENAPRECEHRVPRPETPRGTGARQSAGRADVRDLGNREAVKFSKRRKCRVLVWPYPKWRSSLPHTAPRVFQFPFQLSAGLLFPRSALCTPTHICSEKELRPAGTAVSRAGGTGLSCSWGCSWCSRLTRRPWDAFPSVAQAWTAQRPGCEGITGASARAPWTASGFVRLTPAT